MISIFFTQNGLFVESDTGKAIRNDYTIKRYMISILTIKFKFFHKNVRNLVKLQGY